MLECSGEDLRSIFPETALQLETVSVSIQLGNLKDIIWSSSGVEKYPLFEVQLNSDINYVLKPAFSFECKGLFWVGSSVSESHSRQRISNYVIDVELWFKGSYVCEVTLEAFSIEAILTKAKIYFSENVTQEE